MSIPKDIRSAFSSSGRQDGIVVPGTLWCGWGNNTKDPSELGTFADVDSCCRDHDQCFYNVVALTTRDHYWNYRPMTVSHCDCDDKFFDCLKGVKENKFVADNVGWTFFNLAEPTCVKKEYGKYCKVWDWQFQWPFYGCQETAEGMLAIPYSYLNGKWDVADSVQEVLENPPTAIPPVLINQTLQN